MHPWNSPLKRTTAVLAASLLLGLSTGVRAETVTLRVADWMPETHHIAGIGGKAFMDKARELGGERLKFQYFPAEQLGKAKDTLQLAQTGVADIVNIAPAYITDKFPLSGVAELPGIYEGACRGTYALQQLTSPGGSLYENEFKPNRVRVLFTAAIGAYRVMTADKEVKTRDDFKGLKLRTAGGPMDQTAASLGAVSIRMAGPDVLVSLSRGTLDGVFWPIQSVQPWGLQNDLKYWTSNVGVGSFVAYYAISERKWQQLPKDIQDILKEAGDYATKLHCEYVDDNEAKEIAALQEIGIQPVALPDDDAAAVQSDYDDIYRSWAESLEKRRRPGETILKDFQDAVAQQP